MRRQQPDQNDNDDDAKPAAKRRNIIAVADEEKSPNEVLPGANESSHTRSLMISTPPPAPSIDTASASMLLNAAVSRRESLTRELLTRELVARSDILNQSSTLLQHMPPTAAQVHPPNSASQQLARFLAAQQLNNNSTNMDPALLAFALTSGAGGGAVAGQPSLLGLQATPTSFVHPNLDATRFHQLGLQFQNTQSRSNTSSYAARLQDLLRLQYAHPQLPVASMPETTVSSVYAHQPRFALPSAAATLATTTMAAAATSTSRSTSPLHRCLVPISISSDRLTLSECQSLIREQILLFEVKQNDIDANAQGRNKPLHLGQVGIICRHCAHLPAALRSRGSVYYPAKLRGLYQAAQNMTTNHFYESCPLIPQDTRTRILALKEINLIVRGGGKQYWSNAAQVAGVKEGEDGLAFTTTAEMQPQEAAKP
jgi:hypothetical protein